MIFEYTSRSNNPELKASDYGAHAGVSKDIHDIAIYMRKARVTVYMMRWSRLPNPPRACGTTRTKFRPFPGHVEHDRIIVSIGPHWYEQRQDDSLGAHCKDVVLLISAASRDDTRRSGRDGCTTWRTRRLSYPDRTMVSAQA